MGIYIEYTYFWFVKTSTSIAAFSLTIIVKLASTEILYFADFCFKCCNLKEKKVIINSLKISLE